MTHFPSLIAGGGPVAMTLARSLASHGMSPLLAERSPTPLLGRLTGRARTSLPCLELRPPFRLRNLPQIRLSRPRTPTVIFPCRSGEGWSTTGSTVKAWPKGECEMPQKDAGARGKRAKSAKQQGKKTDNLGSSVVDKASSTVKGGARKTFNPQPDPPG
ncbi:MAG: hypothetical protein QOD06_1106 [Candidatus Binatota bacterium]|nr:hypothetical protein [Candidatus Binatota bacterium]